MRRVDMRERAAHREVADIRRCRGTTTRSMASAARDIAGRRILAGKKLMIIFSVADLQPAVAENDNILSFPWRSADEITGRRAVQCRSACRRRRA